MVGSGSFGAVHLAINNATGGLFVVKSAQSEAGLRCLENEAEILENLMSPYIVHCIGREYLSGKGAGNEFNLFLEYVPGGNLSDVMEKLGGKFDEKVIRLYTREILMGLKYIHESGIVHCDLKCKNVLLDTSGRVKLADFGCAKKKNELIPNGFSVAGTPSWMAPEILRRENLDFSADIWSLGCTVIEMATGRPPWGYEITNPMAALMKIACSDETPKFPCGFSKEGIDFLEKCLERNPRKRWKTEELLSHPFVSGVKQEETYSPSSVLDVGVCERGYESDESNDIGDFGNIIPFLSTKCFEETRGISWDQSGFLSSSENWVTVRSG